MTGTCSSLFLFGVVVEGYKETELVQIKKEIVTEIQQIIITIILAFEIFNVFILFLCFHSFCLQWLIERRGFSVSIMHSFCFWFRYRHVELLYQLAINNDKMGIYCFFAHLLLSRSRQVAHVLTSHIVQPYLKQLSCLSVLYHIKQ